MNSSGFGAAEAYVCRSPITTVSMRLSYRFELRNCIYFLKLLAPNWTDEEIVAWL